MFLCLQDHSEIVLDSSEVSTENGKTSRFPKPEMEIQFTPLQPSKMEVKHQGSTIPVTVKMLKPRKKRKSEEMDEVWPRPTNILCCAAFLYYSDHLLKSYPPDSHWDPKDICRVYLSFFKHHPVLPPAKWMNLWPVMNKVIDFNLSRLWPLVSDLHFLFAFYTSLSLQALFATASSSDICGIADQFYRIFSFGLDNHWCQL